MLNIDPSATQGNGLVAPDTSKAAANGAVHRGKLERAGVRQLLIVDLAKQDASNVALAQRYACTEAAIRQFADRHAPEIGRARTQMADALSGLWVTSKAARCAELQGMYEALTDRCERGEIDVTELARLGPPLLRSVAEELGQIPNKTTVVQAQPFEVRILDDNVSRLPVLDGEVVSDSGDDTAEPDDSPDAPTSAHPSEPDDSTGEQATTPTGEPIVSGEDEPPHNRVEQPHVSLRTDPYWDDDEAGL